MYMLTLYKESCYMKTIAIFYKKRIIEICVI